MIRLCAFSRCCCNCSLGRLVWLLHQTSSTSVGWTFGFFEFRLVKILFWMQFVEQEFFVDFVAAVDFNLKIFYKINCLKSLISESKEQTFLSIVIPTLISMMSVMGPLQLEYNIRSRMGHAYPGIE